MTSLAMSRLLQFPTAVKRDPKIEVWMHEHPGELGTIAQHWFEVIRGCGDDVRELLHDGHPTACVGGAAFVYVNAFKAHVNVGFFRGAEIADPKGLLEGSGKFMRHVKLRPGSDFDDVALRELIRTAYADMKERLRASVFECEERLRRAQLDGNVAELERLLDDELIFTALDGSIVGKQDDLALHRSGRLRITQMEPVERRVLILGGIAVVNAKMNAAAYFDGALSEGLLRYTRVWCERPDGYRIVAGHMSVVP